MVDVGFWGGAVPGNLADLEPLWEAGVFGFKCFLAPSGVDEFPPLDPDQFHAALAEIARFDGLMIVHAEDAARARGRALARRAGPTPTSCCRGRTRPSRRRSSRCSTAPARPAPGCTSCTCPAPARST